MNPDDMPENLWLQVRINIPLPVETTQMWIDCLLFVLWVESAVCIFHALSRRSPPLFKTSIINAAHGTGTDVFTYRLTI